MIQILYKYYTSIIQVLYKYYDKIYTYCIMVKDLKKKESKKSKETTPIGMKNLAKKVYYPRNSIPEWDIYNENPLEQEEDEDDFIESINKMRPVNSEDFIRYANKRIANKEMNQEMNQEMNDINDEAKKEQAIDEDINFDIDYDEEEKNKFRGGKTRRKSKKNKSKKMRKTTSKLHKRRKYYKK